MGRIPVIFFGLALLMPALCGADQLAAARGAYEKRADPSQARSAVDLFMQAAVSDPRSYEALWEGARACYYYGNFARESAPSAEKLAIFDDGVKRARAAVALKPDGAEGHFWLGVLVGVHGEEKGIFKALGSVPEIQKEMEACLKLDPAVECAGPHRLLGRLYFKLPFFKGGDNKKSIEYLEKAVSSCPGNALAKLYLAETLKAEGQKPRARALLEEIAKMQPDPRWVPEHKFIKAQAEKLLGKKVKE